MSTKTIVLAAGLGIAGISWAESPCDARQGRPEAPASAASESPAGTPTVILLSSGKVLRGELSETETGGYVLRQKLGPIPLARREVERTFPTLRAAYEYKRDLLVKGDPDEHMKLAQWCLNQGLKVEAKEQLSAILALVDDHPTASAMLAKLNAADERAAKADPEVVRTSLEGRPEEIDPATLRGPRAKPSPLGRPVIFDLPPALAARRFQEFNAHVQPELQRRCASCHNEQSDRKFQLLQGKTSRALADGLVQRTNLDAALRFIDPENPARSELLVNAAMPHGGAKQPVYSGPNHPGYRTLAAWVASLRVATPTAQAVAPAPGGFAADRLGAPAAPMAAPSPPVAREVDAPRTGAVHPSVPADVDFRTLSPVLGSGPDAAPIGKAARAPALPPGVPPEALKPLTAADLDKLAGKSKAKPIDPKKLQQVLQNRTSNP